MEYGYAMFELGFSKMERRQMRGLTLATVVALTLEFTMIATGQASESVPKTAATNLPYPDQVSLIQEPLGWTYRQSETGLALYLSDSDSPGKSVCTGGCATQWLPLLAPAAEKPIGEWKIVVRKDGLRQWTFKGRPVYTHIHDTPEAPTGDGEQGTWHLMPHFH